MFTKSPASNQKASYLGEEYSLVAKYEGEDEVYYLYAHDAASEGEGPEFILDAEWLDGFIEFDHEPTEDEIARLHESYTEAVDLEDEIVRAEAEIARVEQKKFEAAQAIEVEVEMADEARRSELRPLSSFAGLAKPDTLRRAAIEGRLQAEKLGRNWFATKDDVLRYLKRSNRPPVTLRGLLEQVTREASAWGWSAGVFKGALALAHSKISALGEGDDAPVPQNDVRFILHQALNRLAHEARAAATGQPLVVWFFSPNAHAEQLSLFSGGTETIPDVFGIYVRDTVIGRGCKDLAEAYGWVRAHRLFYVDERHEFDPAQDYDWGWRDDLGDHIERYDAESRTFVRKSMSGRHDYAIRLDADGRVLSVEAGPQLLMRRANIEALLDIDLTRPVRWSEIVRPVFSW